MLGSQAPKSLQVLTLASVPCIARWAPEEERQGSGVDQPPNVIPFMVHDSCHTRKAPEEAGRAAGRGQAWAAGPRGSQILGGWMGEMGEGWSGPASASAELPFRASSQLVRALPLFCPEGHRPSKAQAHTQHRVHTAAACSGPYGHAPRGASSCPCSSQTGGGPPGPGETLTNFPLSQHLPRAQGPSRCSCPLCHPPLKPIGGQVLPCLLL